LKIFPYSEANQLFVNKCSYHFKDIIELLKNISYSNPLWGFGFLLMVFIPFGVIFVKNKKFRLFYLLGIFNLMILYLLLMNNSRYLEVSGFIFCFLTSYIFLNFIKLFKMKYFFSLVLIIGVLPGIFLNIYLGLIKRTKFLLGFESERKYLSKNYFDNEYEFIQKVNNILTKEDKIYNIIYVPKQYYYKPLIYGGIPSLNSDQILKK